jgi:molybdenum cofactor synthesis domain-containing protein
MIRIAIVTVSDSAVLGTREDQSGPAVSARAEKLGWTVLRRDIVADDSEQISELLKDIADHRKCDLILTTGGTGVAPRDVTPEATRAVIEREVPGLPELMRSEGLKHTPLAVLSRAVCGTRRRCLILNLPGSPKGAVESLDAVAHLIPHVVNLLHGITEHPLDTGETGRSMETST